MELYQSRKSMTEELKGLAKKVEGTKFAAKKIKIQKA